METLKASRSLAARLAKNIFPQRRLDQHFLPATVLPLLLSGILYTLQHTSLNLKPQIDPSLVPRVEQAECLNAPLQQDSCTFVREHCPNFDNDGLIPYFRMFYCAPVAGRPYLLISMFVWLMALFASMATAAGDFLSIHLGVIVTTLSISESVAGVTIFAFGNGSSDLFSTLAAMNSRNGSLAISELFGAAAFINTVVLGLIAMTKPFSVDPSSFVGDIVWFIVAASALTAFLADGKLVLGECVGIVGLYLAFVCYTLLRPKSPPSPSSSPITPHVITEPAEPEGISEDNPEQSDETVRLLRDQPYPSSEPRPAHPRLTTRPAEETSETNEEAVQSRASVLNLSLNNNSRVNLSPHFIKIFPGIQSWKEQTVGENILTLFSLPLLVPIGLTTPVDLAPADGQREVNTDTTSETTLPNPSARSDILDPRCTTQTSETGLSPRRGVIAENWILCLQYVLGSQFLAVTLITQTRFIQINTSNILFAAFSGFLLSALLITLLIMTYQSPHHQIKVTCNLVNATFAFTVSLTWIYLIATSAVSLLTTLGFILKIPNAILGATIFAIGNSSNDLIANTAVARRGFPVLAASACFGGPMLNMLLGIGCGALVQVLNGEVDGIYSFDVSPGLFVSVANLLIGLGVTLTYAFCNSWRLDRRLGMILVGTWVVFTVLNVAVSAKRP